VDQRSSDHLTSTTHGDRPTRQGRKLPLPRQWDLDAPKIPGPPQRRTDGYATTDRIVPLKFDHILGIKTDQLPLESEDCFATRRQAYRRARVPTVSMARMAPTEVDLLVGTSFAPSRGANGSFNVLENAILHFLGQSISVDATRKCSTHSAPRFCSKTSVEGPW
jgi:hypothetical protein